MDKTNDLRRSLTCRGGGGIRRLVSASEIMTVSAGDGTHCLAFPLSPRNEASPAHSPGYTGLQRDVAPIGRG